MNYLIKTGVFSLVGNYLRPSNNYRQSSFNINVVVLILITVFLKTETLFQKLKKSKVTDYAALTFVLSFDYQ